MSDHAPGQPSGDGSHESPRAAGRLAKRMDAALGLAAKIPGAVLPVVTVGAAAVVFPYEMPAGDGFLGPVLSTWLFVWLARLLGLAAALVLLAGAFFILRSILARLEAGHWVWKVGPIESDTNAVQQVDDALEELEGWQARATEAQKTIEDLRLQLGEATGTITVLSAALEATPQKDFIAAKANPPA